MRPNKKDDRNRAIIEMVQKETFEVVGREFGISKQRISQICEQYGYKHKRHIPSRPKGPTREIVCPVCSMVLVVPINSKQKLCSAKCRNVAKTTRYDEQGRVRCSKCGEHKDRSSFYGPPGHPDAYCIPCRKLFNDKRYIGRKNNHLRVENVEG